MGLGLPPIPFVQKSADQIVEENAARSPPAQQQNIDLSGGQDKTAQFGYLSDAQDFTPELANIRALLEGKIMMVGKKGNVYYDYPDDGKGNKICKPFCNALGQAKIFGFVSTILQKGTPLSNYSIDTSLDRDHVTSRVITRQIYIKADEWEIDPDEMEGMVELLMDRIETARRRSVDNKERSLVQETITMLQNLTGKTNEKPGLIQVQGRGRM